MYAFYIIKNIFPRSIIKQEQLNKFSRVEVRKKTLIIKCTVTEMIRRKIIDMFVNGKLNCIKSEILWL